MNTEKHLLYVTTSLPSSGGSRQRASASAPSMCRPDRAATVLASLPRQSGRAWRLGPSLLLLLALLALSGCATLVAGGPDHVHVATNPAGATVFVDNAAVGKAPTTVTLDRAKPKVEIRLELAGFAPVTVTRGKSVNGWLLGNVFLGGLIGLLVDIAVNNGEKFDDEPIAVGFGANPPPGPEARIAECTKKREQYIEDARKLPDKRDRLAALRKAPVCR